MGKWDDDYIDSDAYLGYGSDDAKLHSAPTELAGDPYAGGASMQKLVEILLPAELRKYAQLVQSCVRHRVGWLSSDEKRDALNLAATALCTVARNRKPGFSEAQFCTYIKKTISGQLMRHYAVEIAYRAGRSVAAPGIGLVGGDADWEKDRKPCPPSVKRKQPPIASDRDAKLQKRRQCYHIAGGLLPTRHREILRRRSQGETLQAIGADLGVSPQRVRELEQRAEVMLNEKLARIKQGEKLQLLIRETAVQDPANAKLEPYEIDNLVRAWINPDAKQAPANTPSNIQCDEGGANEYDPDDPDNVRTEEDYSHYTVDIEDGDFEHDDDDGAEHDDYYHGSDWRYDEAANLEDL